MAQFEICITEKGRELLAASVGGEPLTFAKMVLGDGGYGGDLSQVEGVISPKIQLEIGSVERYENQVSIQSVITPGTEVPPFFWREVGVYAQDPASGGEVLVVYGNAGDKGDYLSGAGGILDEKIINITILVEPDQVVTDFSGVLFVTQKEFAAHTGDSGIHVTAADKQKWDSRTVFPLAHAKSETTHALTGLSGVSGTVSCVFTATAAYAAGDTFTVDGTAYTIQLSNGEEAEDNLFVAGASVPVVVDTAGKKVNFKAAGGQKLPAGTMDVLAILTQNGTFIVPQTGIYKITAIGHGGFGGFGAWGRDSYTLTGGGGAAGGIATVTKDLKKGESYTITVNDSQSSFGNLVTAIAGGNGSGINPGIGGSGSGDQVWNGGNGIIGNEISSGGGFVNGADGGSTSSQAPFGGAKGSPGKIAGFKNPPYNMVEDDSIRPYLLNDRNFGSIQNKYFGFGAGCGSSAAARTADGEWVQVITGHDTDIDYPMGANGAIFVEMVLD